MRLVRVGEEGREKPGIVDENDELRDASSIVEDWAGDALSGESLRRVRAADLSRLPRFSPTTRLGPCVGGTRHFLAVGLNYADHAHEVKVAPPSEPVIFNKAASSIAGPADPIVLPKGTRRVDWEAELAIVIGEPAYRIAPDDAVGVIAGFCVCNDVSERSWQLEGTGQWVKGKSAPSFGPLGPWLVTPDEVTELDRLRVWLELNGERMQESSTGQMIFGPTYLVAYVSRFMRLEPGDVITTGTPAGVGMGRTPPRFLSPGDRVRLGIDSLGVQVHPVVAGIE